MYSKKSKITVFGVARSMSLYCSENYIPVPESGCWLWLGKQHVLGYGRIGNNGSAHRWFYEFHVGSIPSGMSICHKCDTPCCVNPDHLFIGTRAENNADMHSKGRARRGSSLCAEKARAIYMSTDSRRSLTKQYGVCLSTIEQIRSGRRWREATKGIVK